MVAGDSGYLIEKLELVRWSVGQRLGLLSRKLQTAADRPGGGKVGDEGEYSHLSATERVLRSILLPLTDRRFEEGRLILVSL